MLPFSSVLCAALGRIPSVMGMRSPGCPIGSGRSLLLASASSEGVREESVHQHQKKRYLRNQCEICTQLIQGDAMDLSVRAC